MEGKVSEDEEREIIRVRAETSCARLTSQGKMQATNAPVFLSLNYHITDHSQESSAGCGPCSISGAKHKHLAPLTTQVQINLILHDNWVIW